MGRRVLVMGGKFQSCMVEKSTRGARKDQSMRPSFTKLGIMALFCMYLSGAAVVWGQDPTGRILGTITDPKGGTVPGAKIRVTNIATQIHTTIVSGNDGAFQVLDLPIGTYKVEIEKDGFRKAVIENQTLTINRALRVDVQMELGSTSEVVEVSSQVTGVETVSATIGQTMTGSSITALPLHCMNTYDLATLLPGVLEVTHGSTAPANFVVPHAAPDPLTFQLSRPHH